jgi:hypothetical protein
VLVHRDRKLGFCRNFILYIWKYNSFSSKIYTEPSECLYECLYLISDSFKCQKSDYSLWRWSFGSTHSQEKRKGAWWDSCGSETGVSARRCHSWLYPICLSKPRQRSSVKGLKPTANTVSVKAWGWTINRSIVTRLLWSANPAVLVKRNRKSEKDKCLLCKSSPVTLVCGQVKGYNFFL